MVQLLNAGPILRSLHTAPYKKYVAVLVLARHQAGISQQELARRLGKPQSFVAKYEIRERRLDVPEFIAIAQALGVTAKSLLGRIEKALAEKK